MTDVRDRTREQEQADRSRLGSIWWAGVLIWIGLVLGAEHLEILPSIGDRSEWWPWVFVGVGPWSVVMNVYRTASIRAPAPATWDWIWTVVFLVLAAEAFVDVEGRLIGPVLLVAVGVALLIRALTRPT